MPMPQKSSTARTRPAGSVSVAIPDSALSDESQRSEKARKASVLARACAIFGVATVYVYRDGAPPADAALLPMMLRYLETPQFLRRGLFPRAGGLRYAGVMHPLRIPSHAVAPEASDGEVREGVVVSVRGRKFADVGTGRPVEFVGRAAPGRRVTVRMRGTPPRMQAREASRSDAPSYWGYAVRERPSLLALMREWGGEIIITTRRGRQARPEQFSRYAGRDTLVVFGSPERGVHEILGCRPGSIQNARSLDFFPGQATETVRLEEALLGALAMFNAGVRR